MLFLSDHIQRYLIRITVIKSSVVFAYLLVFISKIN